MKVSTRSAREFVRQRWKNGGGTTTELAREGAGERFLWRLSVADVDSSGPFSSFPGYERTIVLLEGDGMELTIDGRVARLDRAFEPFVFDGGAATTCRLLGGPCRDLNVIVDRARASARVAVIEEATRLEAACALLYAPGGDLVRIDDGAGENVEPRTRAILVQVFAP
jgi:environmental stress-induced protein Ves